MNERDLVAHIALDHDTMLHINDEKIPVRRRRFQFFDIRVGTVFGYLSEWDTSSLNPGQLSPLAKAHDRVHRSTATPIGHYHRPAPSQGGGPPKRSRRWPRSRMLTVRTDRR